VSQFQKGKTNLDFTEARDSEWRWHQLGHMQVCTSLRTDNHASTPPLSFLQAGCPSCHPTNSVKALKAYQWLMMSIRQQVTSAAATAAGIVRHGAVPLHPGELATAHARQTRLVVAGQVRVGRARHARLADGVGAPAARPRGADPGRAGRAAAADASSTAAVSARPGFIPVGPRVMPLEIEARRTVTFHRRSVAFSQRGTW